jgi:DNA polymerase-3 subunit delta'
MTAGRDIWAELVGQEPLVGVLRPAVEAAEEWVAGRPDAAMTHAWLVTGPPGSGRSNAARAFAGALQCPSGGCGGCAACQQVLAGSHPDVTVVDTEGLSISVDDVRELVLRAAMAPTLGRWSVIVVEDADRLTEQAANALLKSLEEPSARTLWMLCAPTSDDVLPTIRSRCRQVSLRTPPTAAVAAALEQSGAQPALAAFAARASQGHIGRARALARDEAVRNRRREVLEMPLRLRDPGDCVRAADNVHEAAKEESEAVAATLERRELAAHAQVWGTGTRGAKARGEQGALSELKKTQKARRTRLVRDSVDRALLDLLSAQRDVLRLQMGGEVELVNEEMRAALDEVARRTSAARTLRRIEALVHCREAMTLNVAPLLALEQAFLRLARA